MSGDDKGRSVVVRTEVSEAKKERLLTEVKKLKKEVQLSYMLSKDKSNLSNRELMFKHVVNFKGFLRRTTVYIDKLSLPEIIMHVKLKQGSVVKEVSFPIKQGVTKINEKIDLPDESVLSVSFDHPTQTFNSLDVLFTGIITNK